MMKIHKLRRVGDRYEVVVAENVAGTVFRSPGDRTFPWRFCWGSGEEGLAETRKEAIERLLRTPSPNLGAEAQPAGSGPVAVAEYQQQLNWYGEPTGYLKRVGTRSVCEITEDLKDHLGAWWRERRADFGCETGEWAPGPDQERWDREAGCERLGAAYCSPADEKHWVGERPDGGRIHWGERDLWPVNELVLVLATAGNSEGHYVHVESVSSRSADRCHACKRSPRKEWLSAKTLLGPDHAWALAREIARLLGLEN